MADPVSVLANAGALVQLIRYAYETISAFTRSKPDRELDELACEVQTLGTACDVVHEQFKQLGPGSVPDGLTDGSQGPVDQKLMSALEGVVADCERTLAQLNDLVNNIRGHRSSFERSARLIGRRDSIVDMRRKIHSHTLALQLIAHSLNINVSYISPRIANQELLTKIDNLKRLIEESMRPSEVQQGGEANCGDKPADNVVEYARETATRGQTLYESSVAASSLYGVATQTHLARVEDWLRNGSRMRSMSYSTTASFNPPAPSTVRGSDRAPDTDPSTSPELPRGSTERVFTHRTMDSQDTDPDQDFAGDTIKLELFNDSKAASEEAFSASEFHTAKQRLLGCLEIVPRMPSHHRPSIDEVWDLKYRLAVCSFHLDEPIEIERVLQEALQYTASANTERRKLYHASHLLAQLHCSTGKLDRALQTCENTLCGRRSLLGNQDHEYFCSLALMNKILELQGHSILAEMYLRQIPEMDRPKYERTYEGMSCSDEVVFRTMMDILPEIPALNGYEGLAQGGAFVAKGHGTAANSSSHAERASGSWADNATASAPSTTRHSTSFSASTIADPFRSPTLQSVNLPHLNKPSLVTQAHDRERWLQILGICPSNGLQPASALGQLKDVSTSSRFGRPKNAMLDAQGLTTLHLASLFGDLELVSSLASAGIHLDATYKPLEANEYFFESARPIELAVAARKVDVVRTLLENGASYTDWSGRSNLPLWLMHSRWLEVTNCRDSREIIDILEVLHESAHIKANDHLASDTFMLHRALRTAGYFTALDWLDVIRYLRSRGANRVAIGAFGCWSNDDVNLLAGESYPLGLALRSTNADSGVRYEMAALLLESGANVSPVDREGKSARQLVHLLDCDHQSAFEHL